MSSLSQAKIEQLARDNTLGVLQEQMERHEVYLLYVEAIKLKKSQINEEKKKDGDIESKISTFLNETISSLTLEFTDKEIKDTLASEKFLALKKEYCAQCEAKFGSRARYCKNKTPDEIIERLVEMRKMIGALVTKQKLTWNRVDDDDVERDYHPSEDEIREEIIELWKLDWKESIGFGRPY